MENRMKPTIDFSRRPFDVLDMPRLGRLQRPATAVIGDLLGYRKVISASNSAHYSTEDRRRVYASLLMLKSNEPSDAGRAFGADLVQLGKAFRAVEVSTGGEKAKIKEAEIVLIHDILELQIPSEDREVLEDVSQGIYEVAKRKLEIAEELAKTKKRNKKITIASISAALIATTGFAYHQLVNKDLPKPTPLPNRDVPTYATSTATETLEVDSNNTATATTTLSPTETPQPEPFINANRDWGDLYRSGNFSQNIVFYETEPSIILRPTDFQGGSYNDFIKNTFQMLGKDNMLKDGVAEYKDSRGGDTTVSIVHQDENLIQIEITDNSSLGLKRVQFIKNGNKWQCNTSYPRNGEEIVDSQTVDSQTIIIINGFLTSVIGFKENENGLPELSAIISYKP